MAENIKSQKFIGFPKPLLGFDNLRIPVVYEGADFLALNVPAGSLLSSHAWYPRCPVLIEALRHQLKNGKPELLRLGFDPKLQPDVIYNLDPGISGIALIAKNKESVDALRNRFGSYQLKLSFHFITRGRVDTDSFNCDLPVAAHFTQPRMLVSHKTGKRAETQFNRIEQIGSFALWEAVVDYYRMDQLSLHALEVGLPVVGDLKYADEPYVFLSDIKRRYRGNIRDEKPLYDYQAAHLAMVRFEGDDGKPIEIKADLPKKFHTLLKKLREFC